jgi:hypothetical protein
MRKILNINKTLHTSFRKLTFGGERKSQIILTIHSFLEAVKELG